jgi:hypothetical protein
LKKKFYDIFPLVEGLSKDDLEGGKKMFFVKKIGQGISEKITLTICHLWWGKLS